MSASEAALELLQRAFGHRSFRAGQGELCAALLEGRDAIAVLPTGAGKSLCFQLPALSAFERGAGTTVVVSPLIALMDDQVDALRGQGVDAAAMHSHQSADDNDLALEAFEAGDLALLYLSPERLASPGFRRSVVGSQVALLAVDEAHCISQWGHDFRPDYARIDELRTALRVPCIALTATATPKVVAEIEAQLGLKEPFVHVGDFARPSLEFRCEEPGSDVLRLERVIEILREDGFGTGQAPGRAIVYGATRKRVDQVAAALKKRGIPALPYHAGLGEAVRTRAQASYVSGRTPVLVATNAFGMGIDQSNVRLVIHVQAPGSLEAYYQEAGRAGRDGLPARCVLLDAPADRVLHRRLGRSSSSARNRALEASLSALDAYAAGGECRQVIIARYFGVGEPSACGRCDECSANVIASGSRERRLAEQASYEPLQDDGERALIVAAVEALSRPVGKSLLARALRGSRAKALRRYRLQDLPQHGALGAYSEGDIAATIDDLVACGELERRGQKYPTVWRAGKPVRASPNQTSLSRRGKRGDARGTRRPARRGSELKEALVSYRRKQARALNWKLYMVFNNQVIDAIERLHPDSFKALEAVPGLGPSKVERFGVDLLAIVARHH